MFEKEKSTPAQQEHKKEGLPVPIWFIAILAIAILAAAFVLSLMAGMSESKAVSDTPNSGEGGSGSELNPSADSNNETDNNDLPTDKVYLGENPITTGVSDINDNKGITIRAGETVFVDGISISIPSSHRLSNDEDRSSFYISNVKRIGTDEMTFCICADYTIVINEIRGVLFLKKDGTGAGLNAFFNGESVKKTRISIPPGKKIAIEMILYDDSSKQYFSRDEMDRVDIMVGATKVI